MTLREKTKELYESLKDKCAQEGKCLAWEVHLALNRYLKEHPEDEIAWFSNIEPSTEK